MELRHLREQAGQVTSGARDEVAAAVERAEGALDGLKDSVATLRGHAATSTDDIREDAGQLVLDLRQATRDAAARLRPSSADTNGSRAKAS